jgi:hypothetical protein
VTGDEANPDLSVSLWNSGSQTGDLFYFSEVRVERVFALSAPSEWIPADTATWKAYANGNTFDPATGFVTEAKGAPLPNIAYLNEPARTNLLSNSETVNIVDLPGVAAGGALLGVASMTTPRGGLADVMTMAHSANPGLTYVRFGVLPEAVVCSSVFVKVLEKSDRPDVARFAYSWPDSNINYIDIDLVSGNVIDVAGDAVGGVEKYPDGWLRVWVSGDLTGDQSARRSEFRLMNRDWGGLYALWGVQCEESIYPSSYIPTAGAPVTRADDALTYVDGHQSTANGWSCVYDAVPLADAPLGGQTFAFGSLARANYRNTANYVFFAVDVLNWYWTLPTSEWVADQRTMGAVAVEQAGSDLRGITAFNGQITSDLTAGAGLTLGPKSAEAMVGNFQPAYAPTAALFNRFMTFPKSLSTEELQMLTNGTVPACPPEDS